MFLVYQKFGKDKKPSVNIIQHPPEGINSLKTAAWFNGFVDYHAVISLIVHLANKGYLNIKETSEWFGSAFKLIKCKDYNGKNKASKTLMKTLFGSDTTELYLHEITNKQCRSIIQIKKKSTMNKKSGHKVYTKESLCAEKIIYAFVFILEFVLWFAVCPHLIKTPLEIIIVIYFESFFAALTFFFEKTIKYLVFNLKRKKPIIGKVTELLIISIATVIVLFIAKDYFLPFVEPTLTTLIIFVTGVCSILSLIILKQFIRKRNNNAQMIYEEILGFKMFLETAEDKELVCLYKENPNYFYEMLPYAYALNLENEWLARNQNIELAQPIWFSSENTFSNDTIKSSIFGMLTFLVSIIKSRIRHGYHRAPLF